MKIGDKVRFLFDTGGGKIAAIKGNLVYVEDADGFQIPTPINEVVVESSEDSYSTTNMVKAMQKAERKSGTMPSDGRSIKAIMRDGMDDIDISTPDDDDPSLKDITFKQPAEERKGGNMLSAYLAFVPVDPKQFSTTQFETYLVNDSNYYLQYLYLSAENNSWTVRAQGTLEPNTKEFIEEFSNREVNRLSHVCIQLMAFKQDKPFTLKMPVSVQFRIDQVKFFKYHTFQPNDFFEEPALMYTIIENDHILAQFQSPNAEDFFHKEEALDKHNGSAASDNASANGSSDDKLVIDLHAEKLLDNTGGMSSADILNYQLDHFRKVMKEHRHEKGRKIIFIHGKGEGVLRHAIIHELGYRYRPCTYQDASFVEYGYGATQVTIK